MKTVKELMAEEGIKKGETSGVTSIDSIRNRVEIKTKTFGVGDVTFEVKGHSALLKRDLANAEMKINKPLRALGIDMSNPTQAEKQLSKILKSGDIDFVLQIKSIMIEVTFDCVFEKGAFKKLSDYILSDEKIKEFANSMTKAEQSAIVIDVLDEVYVNLQYFIEELRLERTPSFFGKHAK